MLLGVLFFVELELKKHSAPGGFELPFFEADPISVAGQPDAEYIMLIEDKIPFLFHPEQVVHPVALGVLLIASRHHVGAIRILGKEL
jgi:hypothetical protein